MMFTERDDLLEMFASLPYKKKVCFVPFETSCECASTLRFVRRKQGEEPFWRLLNGIPRGMYNDYDVISLLNDGVVNHNRVMEET